ncbi:hypothetical protein DFH28DRAFT_449716 [Melampsora americana]|nr:hypothetical protein DFH28DRAFT_449716 [Melampsora americana]
MPPKKTSQKKAPVPPVAHPIRHTRVTRAATAQAASQAASQVPSQTYNSQQAELSPPPPPGQRAPRALPAASRAASQVLLSTTDSNQTELSPPPPGQQAPRALPAASQVLSQTINSQNTGLRPTLPRGFRLRPASEVMPRYLSQNNNGQQDELSPPTPDHIYNPKPGQKRSILDELPEASGSNMARKKSKVDPVNTSSKRSRKIVTDGKAKGKAKQPLPTFSSSSEHRRVFRSVQNRPSNRSPNADPDSTFDEIASTADEPLRAALKASRYPEHFEIFDQVRRRLSQLLPDEAEEALQTFMDPESSLFISEDHPLDEDVKLWRKRIEQINQAFMTVMRAQSMMLWSSVLEVITDVEELINVWRPDRTPPQNQYAGRHELPDQWLIWKIEALLWMGDIDTAMRMYPLLTPASDSIDRRDRLRVEGLLSYSFRSYEQAIKDLVQAVDGSGEYFGAQSDQIEKELRKLIACARELSIPEARLRRTDGPGAEEFIRQEGLADQILIAAGNMIKRPKRLIELPMRIRAHVCSLMAHWININSYGASGADQLLSSMRHDVREISLMTGFRFNRRNQVLAEHKPDIIAAYVYLARSEQFYSRVELARHNWKVVERLLQEGWGQRRRVAFSDAEVQAGCSFRGPNSPDVPAESAESPQSPQSVESAESPQSQPSHPPTPNYSKIATRQPEDRLPTFYDYKRYYFTLGLSPNVRDQELITQYDRLYHSSDNSKYFRKRLHEAMNVLLNPSSREKYDEQCETMLPPSRLEM